MNHIWICVNNSTLHAIEVIAVALGLTLVELPIAVKASRL
jgi:hypothetical protein